jgi:hypothetical protein
MKRVFLTPENENVSRQNAKTATNMWNNRPGLFFGGTGFPACARAGEGACSTFFPTGREAFHLETRNSKLET